MNGSRSKQIDILRAAAVLLVLGRHMVPCPPNASVFLQRFFSTWSRGGWVGVDLFFVLSGFLVSGLLFREHEKHQELKIGRFLIRRGFKIYPPFWLLIGATIVPGMLGHHGIPWGPVASELLFLQNYVPAMWNHTWSLAVEEHFYLLLAFTFFVLARRPSPRPFALIPYLFAGAASLCLGLRIFTARHHPYEAMTHLFPTHLRLDGLFFGVLLSYAFHRRPLQFLAAAKRFRLLLACGGAALLLPPFYLPLETAPFVSTFGLTLTYLGGGCLLVAALGFQAPASYLGRAFAYVGSHSYSVYLWHMLVARWTFNMAISWHFNYCVYAAAYVVGAVSFGVAMANLTEFPVLRIRDRYFPVATA